MDLEKDLIVMNNLDKKSYVGNNQLQCRNQTTVT